GVCKLPQGSAMTYDLVSDTVNVWPYWTLPAPVNGQAAGEEELIAELDRLLLDSVRLRLIADVPGGIMLSGGVDSSLVTAMAARSCSADTCTTSGCCARNWCGASSPRRCAAWSAGLGALFRWECGAGTTLPARRGTSTGV